jgi:outer membrane autotransporter protein
VIVPPVQPVAAVVVPALLAVAPTRDIVTVLAAINAFSDPAAVVNAVAQLAPSPSTLVAPLIVFHGNRQFQNLWMSRFDCGPLGRRDESVREPDEEKDGCMGDDRRVGWWLNGFGYFAEQDARQAFVGYKARIGGAMGGYDAPIGPDTHMGFGLGYARTGIRAKGEGSRADIDTYQATAYFGHEPGPWFFNAALSYGVNDYSGTRQIAFTGVDREASAEFGGHSYTGFASAGLHLYAGGLTITPLASIEAMRVHVNRHNETGAGDISLRVQARKYDFLESGLGLKVAHSFAVGGGAFEPELHGRWLHELSNPQLSQTAAFSVAGSPSLTTPALSNAKDTYNLGGALNFFSSSGHRGTWSFGAGYDYYGTGDGYSAHQGTVKVTGRF